MFAQIQNTMIVGVYIEMNNKRTKKQNAAVNIVMV